MDGNGRWARARNLPREAGHRAGVEAVRTIVRAAAGRGIDFLTLYCFSTENWARPEPEIRALMALLRWFIRADLARLASENIRIRVIGSREGLAQDVCALLDEAIMRTAANTGMGLVIAFNYGARRELLSAIQTLAEDAARGRILPSEIDEAALAGRLDTAGIPDPDLVIRTSGEQRLSNFLLWQSAYSELFFSPVLWPDFNAQSFEAALENFSARKRRFGGL
jgi:undecaprenyl diphosphate synthase